MIEQHAVAARSAAVTMGPIAAAAVAAASAVIAEEVPEVVVFVEVVAGASGTRGGSEVKVTSPTRGPRVRYGEVSRISLTPTKTAARASN